MKTTIAAIAGLFLSLPLVAQNKETAPAPRKGLVGYKTVAELIKADPKLVKSTNATTRPSGFLGIQVAEANGKPVVEDVEIDSPADKAGVRVGDVLVKVGGAEVKSGVSARDALRGRFAGDPLALAVTRDGKAKDLVATLRAVSRPMTPNASRLGIGVQFTNRDSAPGEVRGLTPGGEAGKAGIKIEDVILKVDGKTFDFGLAISDLVSDKKVGDEVVVSLKRGGKEQDVRVKLAEEVPDVGGRGGFGGGGGGRGAGGPGGGGRGGQGARGGAAGWDDRLPQAWTKKTYKLAVVGVEYPDVKHNPKIADKDWENSLFSIGTYTGKNATGQTVFGSMNDYYKEISYGNFKVDGKFVGWVEMPKKRMEYSTGTGSSNREKTDFLTGAMDKVLAAKGKTSLDGYDGVFILYAGGRTGNTTTRGSLYWPHRSNFNHNGKRWPYFIVNECTGNQGDQMNNISVFCHEFGHMLGLPDLYARPEIPGMYGVGVWDAMSQQSPGGRPQHFASWSKDQLNWVKPTVLDPRVKQKVVLSPIEDDPTQCLKVISRTDGSEYFILENRQKKGFDTSLPAEGLLIWRVLPGNAIQKVYIEGAHGIEGANAPRANLAAVPFPSPANNSFTPYTTPSSKSSLGGGLDVFVTNIRRLPDGRVTFHIGYEFQ